MGQIKFGGKQSINDKVAMATKKGYDTGKASTGHSGKEKPTIKPIGGFKKPGVKIEWKF